MKIINIIQEWLANYPIAISIIKYFIWVIVAIIVIQFLRRIVKRNIPETTTRYKAQKGIEILGYIFLLLLTISYFTGNVKDFTLAIGLFSAGVAITLQELFLSIAGSIYIFS